MPRHPAQLSPRGGVMCRRSNRTSTRKPAHQPAARCRTSDVAGSSRRRVPQTRNARDHGQRRRQPVGIIPEKLETLLSEQRLDGHALQPPEEERRRPWVRTSELRKRLIHHGRQGGSRASQGRPEKADHEQAGKPIKHARANPRSACTRRLACRKCCRRKTTPARRTWRNRRSGAASRHGRKAAPRPWPRAHRGSSRRIHGRNSRGCPSRARAKAPSRYKTRWCAIEPSSPSRSNLLVR